MPERKGSECIRAFSLLFFNTNFNRFFLFSLNISFENSCFMLAKYKQYRGFRQVAGKQMMFRPPRSKEVTFLIGFASEIPSSCSVMLATQSKKLVMNGDQQPFMACIVEPLKKEKKDLQEIPMVGDFSDVFSTEFSRSPLK